MWIVAGKFYDLCHTVTHTWCAGCVNWQRLVMTGVASGTDAVQVKLVTFWSHAMNVSGIKKEKNTSSLQVVDLQFLKVEMTDVANGCEVQPILVIIRSHEVNVSGLQKNNQTKQLHVALWKLFH